MPSVDPTPSGRSRDELLASVVRRGRTLRRRRQAAQGLAGTAVVALLVLGAVQVGAGDGGEAHLVADAPTTVPTTTTTVAPEPTVPTTVAPAPAPTTTPPTTSPPPTAPPTTATTVPADPLAALMGRTYAGTDVTEGGERRVLVDGTEIVLEFASEGGRRILRWSAGCNTSGGEVQSIDGRLHVTDGGGTQMGCSDAHHEQDRWLTSFLLGRPGWTLDGPTLTLTLDDTVIVVEERTPTPR